MASAWKWGRPDRLRFVAGLTWTIAASASAANIWVFTDRQHPVKAAPWMELFELDAPASLEARLSARLPADPKRAAAIVNRRLQEGGAAFQSRLATAYQGVTDAWSLGIAKLPAVVVDRRYVVYGVPNVNRAISLIEEYRSKQR